MDLISDLFKIDQNIKPKAGRILISDPFLNDAYFKRSIVFLTEHNKNGSVGFVLNKPVDVSVNEVLSGFPGHNAAISVGGPVGTDALHYIHSMGDYIPNSVKVMKDIWWGGDFEVVKELLNSGALDGTSIRFFIGYAGWEPMQLSREISENSWLVSELESDRIMNTRNRESWQAVLNALGGKYKLWTNFPENPGLN
ncbi:MAG: YqgE/AlgH family protein [Bacteroidales bacterium]